MSRKNERSPLVSQQKTQYKATAEAATEKVVAVPGSMETLTACAELKRKLSDLKEMLIMVMGKSGVGKTTLIKVICKSDSAEIGRGTGPATNICTTYTIKNEDLTINIVDTPGLYDDEDAYVEMIKEKAGKADIIFFCVDMSSNLCGDDRTALQLMGKHFSPQFLQKTVIVLMKANLVKRFGDNVKNFTKDEYFKIVLTEKITEIATRLEQADLAIDKESLQVAIAGSPGLCEERDDAGQECVMPSERTELVNNVRVHVDLDDYNNPEQWVTDFLITCMTSGATDAAKLALVKIHTNWKKLAVVTTGAGAGSVSSAGMIGGGIAMCLIGAGATPIPIGGVIIGPVLCSVGGIAIALGAAGAASSAAAGASAARKLNSNSQ